MGNCRTCHGEGFITGVIGGMGGTADCPDCRGTKAVATIMENQTTPDASPGPGSGFYKCVRLDPYSPASLVHEWKVSLNWTSADSWLRVLDEKPETITVSELSSKSVKCMLSVSRESILEEIIVPCETMTGLVEWDALLLEAAMRINPPDDAIVFGSEALIRVLAWTRLNYGHAIGRAAQIMSKRFRDEVYRMVERGPNRFVESLATNTLRKIVTEKSNNEAGEKKQKLQELRRKAERLREAIQELEKEIGA